MLYKFDFSLEKFCRLLSLNLDKNGDEARQRDAELIYYYLTQKYAHSEMEEVINNLDSIMNKMSQKEIHNLLLSFCDEN